MKRSSAVKPFFKTPEERETAALFYLDAILPFLNNYEEFFLYIELQKYGRSLPDKDEIIKIIEVQQLIENILEENGFIYHPEKDSFPFKLTPSGRDLKAIGSLKKYLEFNSKIPDSLKEFAKGLSKYESLSKPIEGTIPEKIPIKFPQKKYAKFKRNHTGGKWEPDGFEYLDYNMKPPNSKEYSYVLVEDLPEDGLPIKYPNPTPKSHKLIKRTAALVDIIIRHPFWSTIIGGTILLFISHFIFGTP